MARDEKLLRQIVMHMQLIGLVCCVNVVYVIILSLIVLFFFQKSLNVQNIKKKNCSSLLIQHPLGDRLDQTSTVLPFSLLSQRMQRL